MLLFAQRLAKELGYVDPRVMLRSISVSTFRDWLALNRIEWEDHMKDQLNRRVSTGG